jgi:hypothetical protein
MAGHDYATRESDGVTRQWDRLYGGQGVTPPPPPPPPPGSTIFGFNTAPNNSTRNAMVGWFTRCPMGRGYNSYNPLPISAAQWIGTGKMAHLACIDLLGAASEKRVNLSSRFHPGDITSASSALVTNMTDFTKSVPVGWELWIGHHEYNKKDVTAAQYTQFKTGFQFLSEAAYNQSQANLAAGTGGQVHYVVNAGDSGLGTTPDLSIAPMAGTMAPDYEFWTDSYFNPSGDPTSSYKGYGTTHPTLASVMNNAYDLAEALGCHDNSDGGTRGHGYGEINAPRRIAPKVNPLYAPAGWGPLSPFDVDGSYQASAINAACTFAVGQLDPTRTIPAKVFLLWHADTGTWQQRFDRGGDTTHDDGTAASPGPHFQGFPVVVDPTLPIAAYKAFVDISG